MPASPAELVAASELITADELPTWVPGRLTVRSPESGTAAADAWDGVAVRGYRYGPSDVGVPALRDYTVVAYRRGSTAMRRKVDSDSDTARWRDERVGPGDVSLLTRAAPSHWVWPSDIEVVHVYLRPDEMADVCRQMYEREVDEVALRDELRAADPDIHRTAMLIAAEAAAGAAGSRLMVDSLTQQLAVHILRRHADLVFREPPGSDGLTTAQIRTVRDHVAAHLADKLSLEDLATSVGLSRFHFARRFRASTGTTPHEYVTRARIDRARSLLTGSDQPLSSVAAACGFADQSHLTRVFRRLVGTTPGRFRGRR